MSIYQHCGLYFTGEHIRQAQKNLDREPLRSAWAFLREQEQAGALAALQWDGLRFRFGDDAAGERAVGRLLGLAWDGADGAYFDRLAHLLALTQCFELVRDHPAFPTGEQAAWLQPLAAQAADLNRAADDMAHVETLWLGALNLAAGIALERADWVEHGAEAFRQTIRDEIRPEGYLPRAVEGGDGGSLRRQFLSVAALVLSAEMAAHAGVDLWGYAWRGVSVMTACAYLFYYYYYPEKWRWDSNIEAEAAGLFRRHGGFLEMVNRRARPKAIGLMLDDLRPIYDVTGGGLTTLTHGLPARRGLFG